jgi:hypothetical protein
MSMRAVAAAAAGLTVAALSAGTGLADSAATPTPTQLTLTVSPSTVSYPGPATVTLSGVLETTGATPQGLVGQQVQLTYFYGPHAAALLSATTGSGGAFSVTETVADLPGGVFVPGSFTDEFDGTAQYAQAGGQEVWPQPAQQFPAKIVLNPISPVPYLGSTEVTGQVLMQLPDQSWVPSPYAEVQFSSDNPSSCRPVDDQPVVGVNYADANGDFSLPIDANPGSDQCSVSSTSSGRYQWSAAATAVAVTVPLVADPTEFVNVDIPSPQPVNVLTMEARVASLTATDQAPVYRGPVQLQFRPAGGSIWTVLATTSAGSDGWADFTVIGYLHDGALAAGDWRFVIVPESAAYIGSSIPAIPVVVTVPTHVSARIHGRKITGALAYLARGGTLGHARVAIQKLVDGHWRNVASVLTTASGDYSARLHSAGTYRAWYNGGKLPGAQANYGSFDRSWSKAARLT